jgi:OmpR-family two-component system manganese-sensing response regulator
VVRVLVIETQEVLARPLRAAGQAVTVAGSAAAARRLAATGPFDALVLGALGPVAASLQACDELRREGISLPILLVVADDAVEARVSGLDAGADDCLGLACPVDELLARLRALVRRSVATRHAAWAE